MKWQSTSGRNYSPEELNAMQKDAMERVREMQRRADESLRRSNAALPVQEAAPPPSPPPKPSSSSPPPSAPPQQTPATQSKPATVPAPISGGKLSQILSAAGVDQDRLIILGLLLLLYNDGADPLLLLALLYLLL